MTFQVRSAANGRGGAPIARQMSAAVVLIVGGAVRSVIGAMVIPVKKTERTLLFLASTAHLETKAMSGYKPHARGQNWKQ